MNATLVDVCRHARVSSATVSRVINGSPHVREKTRQHVLKVMETLNYHPSHAARTLARQRTDMIGAVFPEMANGFFAEVLNSLDAVLGEHGYHLLTFFSRTNHDRQWLVQRAIRERRVDALVVVNPSRNVDFAEPIIQAGIPAVYLNGPSPAAGGCSIMLDNRGGVRQAMQHLLEHEYDRLAIIAGPVANYDAQERLAACREVLAETDKKLDADLVWSGAFTESSGQQAVERWLASGRPLPRAIFATNDAMAVGAWRALQEAGYKVPEDVAIVGFDDYEPAQYLGLTTVRVPMKELGRTAAEAIVRLMRGTTVLTDQTISTALVRRRSCGCPGSHPLQSRITNPTEE